jgi:hypothetical protein
MPELATAPSPTPTIPADLRCEGSGSFWITSEHAPVCPVCQRGTRALGIPRPSFWRGQWNGRVPLHER